MQTKFSLSQSILMLAVLIALSACAQSTTASSAASAVNGLPTNISPAASSN